MLFFLLFVVHKPNLVMHFVALILWNVLHFVDKPTWARQIMAYKVWVRVHRVYSNGDAISLYLETMKGVVLIFWCLGSGF